MYYTCNKYTYHECTLFFCMYALSYTLKPGKKFTIAKVVKLRHYYIEGDLKLR